jgi:glycosyltransferase involved in cell wall biosynthesis
MSAPTAPQTSIVVTAYNAERYVGACVRAALAQTFRDIEVLVLDDGSTDRTAEICAAIDDPRLRYMRRPRLGRVHALNEAVAAARAPFIAINDADDLSLPHRVQYTLDALRSCPDVAFVGTGYIPTEVFCESIAAATPAATGSESPIIWPSRAQVYRRNLFVNSTIMYPKTTWQRIGGYDESLTNSEDYDFQLRALQVGAAMLLPGRTVLWYTNPHGYFKQKRRREHHQVVGAIRRRAHRILGLSTWLKLYHPAWIVAQHCPQLVAVVKRLGNGRRGPLPTASRMRTP